MRLHCAPWPRETGERCRPQLAAGKRHRTCGADSSFSSANFTTADIVSVLSVNTVFIRMKRMYHSTWPAFARRHTTTIGWSRETGECYTPHIVAGRRHRTMSQTTASDADSSISPASFAIADIVPRQRRSAYHPVTSRIGRAVFPPWK